MKKKFITLFIFLMLILGAVNASSNTKPTKNGYENKINKNPILLELIQQVNSTKIKSYINELQSFGPHPTGSNTIEKVKQYLLNKLSNINQKIQIHQWEYKEKKGDNIIVTIKGQASSKDIIIVCAHYDTVEVSPGSDDDGSGVASIIMMSEILSKYTHNSTIKLILFSGEEQGLLGSKKYVEELEKQDVNIIGILALDKIGYAKTSEQGKTIRHHANPSSSWMLDITEEISNTYKDEININIEKQPFDGSSDHKSFVDKGYSGSNLVEKSLNPYYHTSEDLLKHMNISYLKKIC